MAGEITEGRYQPCDAETLTEKLIRVVQDPDLNRELRAYMRPLILSGMVEQKVLTKEQSDRVLNASRETLRAMLTPEQREKAAREAARRMSDKPSPFAGDFRYH